MSNHGSKLFFRDYGGAGRPIVILHGLFGSSKNWAGMGKRMSSLGHVIALDQRNHGESFHDEDHSIQALVNDLKEWLDAKFPDEAVVLLGHSMGGSTAMHFCLQYPSRVLALIVADIAPKMYPPHHSSEFAALRLDISRCESRAEVDERMAAILPDLQVRQFLQMNLESIGNAYRWKIPVSILERSTFASDPYPALAEYAGPVLFIAGGQSPYLHLPEDLKTINQLFPACSLKIISEAGHWLHYSHPHEFFECVKEFLLSCRRRLQASHWLGPNHSRRWMMAMQGNKHV